MVTNATQAIRFATFNASLNRNGEGQLSTDLSTPDNAQAKAVAEIIQRANPDILLINEFDYFSSNPLEPVNLFRNNYLAVSQNGSTPVNPYFSQKVRSPTPEALQNEGLNRALASKHKRQCVDLPRLKIIIN